MSTSAVINHDVNVRMSGDVPAGYHPIVWGELPKEVQLELFEEIKKSKSSINPSDNRVGKLSVLGKRMHRSTTDSDDRRSKNKSIVCGSDSLQSLLDTHQWMRRLQESRPFEDLEFPATSLSICGKEDLSKKTSIGQERSTYVVGQIPECFCRALAIKRTVQMNTPNRGREYYSCPSRRCKYFHWMDGDAHIPSQRSKRIATRVW